MAATGLTHEKENGSAEIDVKGKDLTKTYFL